MSKSALTTDVGANAKSTFVTCCRRSGCFSNLLARHACW